jgi:hypothetical protein
MHNVVVSAAAVRAAQSALHPIDLFHRIRAEFSQMPGLRLTLPQARRLFGIDLETSAAILDALVEAQFLKLTPAGAYARAESY